MSGAIVTYAQAKAGIVEGKHNLLTGTYRAVLLSSAYTPQQGTHSTYADVSGDEVSGTGYTTGGAAITGQAVTYGVGSATIVAGGSGYAASTTFDLTVSGGTSTTAARINVTTNASGVVTTVNSITTAGTYSAVPSGPVAVTGGSGTGATFNVIWEARVAVAAVSWANATISAKYSVLINQAGGSLASTDLLFGYNDLNPGGAAISSTNGTFQVSFPNGLINLD